MYIFVCGIIVRATPIIYLLCLQFKPSLCKIFPWEIMLVYTFDKWYDNNIRIGRKTELVRINHV